MLLELSAIQFPGIIYILTFKIENILSIASILYMLIYLLITLSALIVMINFDNYYVERVVEKEIQNSNRMYMKSSERVDYTTHEAMRYLQIMKIHILKDEFYKIEKLLDEIIIDK